MIEERGARSEERGANATARQRSPLAPRPSLFAPRCSPLALRPGGLELTDRALAHCALPEGARVWDVGCGYGETVAHLSQRGFRAGGVDLSLARLVEARTRAGEACFAQASAMALPCASASLDAVFAECVWSVCAGGRALAEWHRALRPGGWLALTDVYARHAMALPLECATSCWGGLPIERDVRDALKDAGFETMAWEDHVAALNAYAAQMIWRQGSLAPLLGVGADQPDAQAALKAARPSYFLLVARKR
ncbi:MAG TPA: class I SAM-dependent methyltransferase [Anaerolineales bacterium]|nr:class I SAM-dependent methyltransferase [Anaerolineales bacterium]